MEPATHRNEDSTIAQLIHYSKKLVESLKVISSILKFFVKIDLIQDMKYQCQRLGMKPRQYDIWGLLLNIMTSY